MPAATQKRGGTGARQRAASDCKPLLEAATKELFRRNAFRITGLPVDATTREVARFADKLKLLAEVGQDSHTQSSAFPMKPPPSLDEIREAFQKLKDPEKRLIDEFFWFWPEEFGDSRSDPAIQALAKGNAQAALEIWTAREKHGADGVVAKHNLALVYHLCALEWDNYAVGHQLDGERRQKVTAYWKDAFNRWEELATNEAFWEKVTDRIRQLNEPNLPTGFARRMRATLPEALDKINAELAVAFAESGQIELTRLHIQFMRETHQGLDNVDKTAEMVLMPARNRLKEHIRAAQERADKNPRDAANAARELLGHAQQTLHLFDLFFEKNSEIRNDLFDEVAGLCNTLSVAYQKATGDDETCLQILKAALPFAVSMELRHQIEQNIGTLSGNLAFKKFEPFYLSLKSLQESKEHPRSKLQKLQGGLLHELDGVLAGLPMESEARDNLLDSIAIVLRGISLEAWNHYQDSATAVAANELALKYGVRAELKRRLEEDKSTLALMRLLNPNASRSQRTDSGAVGCLVWGAIGVIIWAIVAAGKSCGCSDNHSGNRPDRPSTAAILQMSTPSPVAENPAHGDTYRVPSSIASTLQAERAELDSQRGRLEALEAQVQELGAQIDRERLYVDRTSQYSVDAFNAKVGQYNTLVERARTANAAFNKKVDEYNAKLERYGR